MNSCIFMYIIFQACDGLPNCGQDFLPNQLRHYASLCVILRHFASFCVNLRQFRRKAVVCFERILDASCPDTRQRELRCAVLDDFCVLGAIKRGLVWLGALVRSPL